MFFSKTYISREFSTFLKKTQLKTMEKLLSKYFFSFAALQKFPWSPQSSRIYCSTALPFLYHLWKRSSCNCQPHKYFEGESWKKVFAKHLNLDQIWAFQTKPLENRCSKKFQKKFCFLLPKKFSLEDSALLNTLLESYTHVLQAPQTLHLRLAISKLFSTSKSDKKTQRLQKSRSPLSFLVTFTLKTEAANYFYFFAFASPEKFPWWSQLSRKHFWRAIVFL